MKKWLAIIVVLLLLILVVAPGGMGIIAEKRIKTLTENWPTNTPFTVKVLSYDRGWFTSNIQLDVTLTSVPHTPPIHVQVNEVVTHGPVIISFSNRFFGIGQAFAHGELVVPEDQQALFKQYLDQTTLMTNCLFLHLFGSFTVKLNVPEITISNPTDPSTHVIIEGLSTTAKISPKAAHISSSSMMQTLTWEDAASTMTVEDLSGHSDLNRTQEGLWLGDMNLSLESMIFNAGNKTVLSMKNAQYTSSSQEKKGLVSGNTHVSFDNLTMHDVSYGPAEISLNVQNINAEPLAQLKRLAKVMQQQGVNVVGQASKRTEKLILKTIARGMQLTLNPISVQTPNGEVTGQVNISMPNLIDDANGISIKHPHITVGQLISGAEGSLQFTVPKVLVLNNLQETILANMQSMSQMLGNDNSNDKSLAAAAQQRASAQLQGWVAAGLLIESGDNYQFSAAYQQGKLLVNGKPIFNPAFSAGPSVMPMPAPSSGSAPMPMPTPGTGSAPMSMPAPGSAPAPMPAPGTGSAPAPGTDTAPVPAPTPGSAPQPSPAPVANSTMINDAPAVAPAPPQVVIPAPAANGN